MPGESNAWLTELIRAHQAEMAASIAARARQRIPLYAGMPPSQVQAIFERVYQVMAQSLASGDLTVMRAFMQQAIVERLQAGAPAPDLIALIPSLGDEVRAVVDRESATDPRQTAQALRQLQTLISNMRMIVSEINLSLLKTPPPNGG
ncbi:MAG TPA: hypothetical protein VKY74_01035 [Chloroflexia bacterium]|nr:hypothetical protein [Chloroflexia bacterium]